MNDGGRKKRTIAATPGPPDREFDVFISHSTIDNPYVEPLVKALEAAGISVWFDKTSMEWGDSLRGEIDRGLAACRYGIVVFSKAFLNKKKWTEHELNALFAKEAPGKKVILPIWHGISHLDLIGYSPSFADRLAKNSVADSYADIVKSLLKMLGRTVDERGSTATNQSNSSLPGDYTSIRTPSLPASAFNKDRPVGGLLQAQLRHFHHAEPPGCRGRSAMAAAPRISAPKARPQPTSPRSQSFFTRNAVGNQGRLLRARRIHKRSRPRECNLWLAEFGFDNEPSNANHEYSLHTFL